MLIAQLRKQCFSTAALSSSLESISTNKLNPLDLNEKKIKAAFESRQYRKVLGELNAMIKSVDKKPSSLAYFYGVKSCQSLKQLGSAFALVKNMRNSGVLVSPHISTTLISTCATFGEWRKAEQVFYRLKRQHINQKWGPIHISSYVAMLNAYGQGGKWKEALKLLSSMEQDKVSPNLTAYNAAISACSRSGKIDEILSLMECMKHNGIDPDIITYVSSIRGCESSGNWKITSQLLKTLEQQGLVPDARIYSSAILVCRSSKNWKKSEELFHDMQSRGIVPNTIVCNSLLSVFARNGDSASAIELFNEMKDLRDIKSYNSTMDSCVKSGDIENALKIYSLIKLDGLQPNEYTFSIAMCASQKQHDWAMALLLLQEAQKLGLQNKFCYTCAMSVCAVCGKWEQALDLLSQMKDDHIEIDCITYSTAMNACVIGNQPEKAIALWEEMKASTKTMAMDNRSSSIMMRACAQAKQFDYGWKVWMQLVESQQRIDNMSYEAIVSCMSEGGKHELVIELVEQMQKYGIVPIQKTVEVAIQSCEILGLKDLIPKLMIWQQESILAI